MAIRTHQSNQCSIWLGNVQACLAFKIHQRIYQRCSSIWFNLQGHVHIVTYVQQWVLMQLEGWQWLLHQGIGTGTYMRDIYIVPLV